MLVWLDLSLCTSMAPSNIEKNATYLRRYLKNVYYFGYSADFNTKKSYKFGPSGSIDVVSFYYDIYESEPILWYSESNFLRRIFEVEKWAVGLHFWFLQASIRFTTQQDPFGMVILEAILEVCASWSFDGIIGSVVWFSILRSAWGGGGISA